MNVHQEHCFIVSRHKLIAKVYDIKLGNKKLRQSYDILERTGMRGLMGNRVPEARRQDRTGIAFAKEWTSTSAANRAGNKEHSHRESDRRWGEGKDREWEIPELDREKYL